MRVFLLMLIVILIFPSPAVAVDEPPHQVVLKDGRFELRQYEPMLLAEVRVVGSMSRASNNGFRSLADFIFGNNKPAEKISMTAPVTRTPIADDASTNIAMTAPVTRVQNGDKRWTVAFVMPSKWTKESLPNPNNPDVMVREVPAQLIASIKFSGRGSEASYLKQQVKLDAWIAQQGYIVSGEPRYAGYDAPWVLWPFRRNEVMIAVTKAPA